MHLLHVIWAKKLGAVTVHPEIKKPRLLPLQLRPTPRLVFQIRLILVHPLYSELTTTCCSMTVRKCLETTHIQCYLNCLVLFYFAFARYYLHSYSHVVKK